MAILAGPAAAYQMRANPLRMEAKSLVSASPISLPSGCCGGGAIGGLLAAAAAVAGWTGVG